jgi:hypothetical protein
MGVVGLLDVRLGNHARRGSWIVVVSRVVCREPLATLTASPSCWHAGPVGVSAVLTLAPGWSPWRLQSAHSSTQAPFTDSGGGAEQGDPQENRRRRHLPRPRRDHPPRRAVLAEQNDEWTESRRYMGTEILAACRKAAKTRNRENVTDVAGLTIEGIPA